MGKKHFLGTTQAYQPQSLWQLRHEAVRLSW